MWKERSRHQNLYGKYDGRTFLLRDSHPLRRVLPMYSASPIRAGTAVAPAFFGPISVFQRGRRDPGRALSYACVPALFTTMILTRASPSSPSFPLSSQPPRRQPSSPSPSSPAALVPAPYPPRQPDTPQLRRRICRNQRPRTHSRRISEQRTVQN